MSGQRKTLDELLAEYEPERLANLARENAYFYSPAAEAKRAKMRAEHDAMIEREIAEGIRRPDGSLIEPDEDEDEDEDDA